MKGYLDWELQCRF